MEPVYHGEHVCQIAKKNGEPCVNKAYYQTEDKIACGLHSKAANRTTLPENPNKADIIAARIQSAQTEAELAAAQNKQRGIYGKIAVSKLAVMKAPEQKKGFLLVFPNHKDGKRIIGLGLPELSPMSIQLSELEHCQPGLPSTSLENFHQGNKCFFSETIDDNQQVQLLSDNRIQREPSFVFFENQSKMYADETPHRHKILNWKTPEEKKKEQKKVIVKKPRAKKSDTPKSVPTPDEIKRDLEQKDKIPLYSIYWHDGKLSKLTYAESRRIYCRLYVEKVRELPEFIKLRDLVMNGFNLQICGYDGYEITKTVREHYEDPSVPFGHELVLYAMLSSLTSEGLIGALPF